VTLRELVVAGLCLLGIGVTASGVLGLLRMPDVYNRMQASSKTVTLGVLPVLLALVVGEGPISVFGSRALLVAVLVLVMNPVATHALARAAYRGGVPMWSGAVADEPAELAAARDQRAGTPNESAPAQDGDPPPGSSGTARQ
jgi:multicomponent Na+:H+ antiporter subunit G